MRLIWEVIVRLFIGSIPTRLKLSCWYLMTKVISKTSTLSWDMFNMFNNWDQSNGFNFMHEYETKCYVLAFKAKIWLKMNLKWTHCLFSYRISPIYFNIFLYKHLEKSLLSYLYFFLLKKISIFPLQVDRKMTFSIFTLAIKICYFREIH